MFEYAIFRIGRRKPFPAQADIWSARVDRWMDIPCSYSFLNINLSIIVYLDGIIDVSLCIILQHHI